MSNWQPIETADLSDRPILVTMKQNPDLGPVILHWSEQKMTWVVHWNGDEICEIWDDEPWLWMPLPEPPRP